MMDLSDQQFGNYRLVRPLGRGGFASVYLGQHVKITTRQAAIKILHMVNVNKPLFLREAETTSRLRHTNIIQLMDFAEEGETPYLVLDYAPGGSLRKRHPKGSQVPLDTVVQYLKEIVPALLYAHNQGVVHRDIKPDNILVGWHQELLLSDFGIAMISMTGRTKQQTPAAAGTPYYMAPEQFRGKAEEASDQYALAIMVYEWLTGSLPFSEGDAIQLGFQHAYEPVPSLRASLSHLPVSVEAVVMKALSKQPQDRWETIQVFAEALEIAAMGAIEKLQSLQSLHRLLETESDELSFADLNKLLKYPAIDKIITLAENGSIDRVELWQSLLKLLTAGEHTLSPLDITNLLGQPELAVLILKMETLQRILLNFTVMDRQWWNEYGKEDITELYQYYRIYQDKNAKDILSLFTARIVRETCTAMLDPQRKFWALIQLLDAVAPPSVDSSPWVQLLNTLSEKTNGNLSWKPSEVFTWSDRKSFLQRWAYGVQDIPIEQIMPWLQDISWDDDLDVLLSSALDHDWKIQIIISLITSPSMPVPPLAVEIVMRHYQGFNAALKHLIVEISMQQQALSFFTKMVEYRYPNKIEMLTILLFTEISQCLDADDILDKAAFSSEESFLFFSTFGPTLLTNKKTCNAKYTLNMVNSFLRNFTLSDCKHPIKRDFLKTIEKCVFNELGILGSKINKSPLEERRLIYLSSNEDVFYVLQMISSDNDDWMSETHRDIWIDQLIGLYVQSLGNGWAQWLETTLQQEYAKVYEEFKQHHKNVYQKLYRKKKITEDEVKAILLLFERYNLLAWNLYERGKPRILDEELHPFKQKYPIDFMPIQ